MTGTGWITKNATSMNLSSISLSILSPYDVDFDAKGRIYIANNDVSTSSAIIRIDNINDTTPEIAGGVGISSLVAVKVDRSNGLLYYATASQLYRNNLTNSAQILLTTTGISLIKGFTVDSTGTLDIACYFSTPASYAVLKYNPTAQSAGIYYSISPGTPWDVLYKSPYIYVANLSGTVDTQIIRLNASDLTSPLGYGTQVDVSSTNPGEFYGPRRFVAILNKRITLIDDHNSPYPYDKLISMNDITGTIDWQTFGNDTGMGGTFDFYTQC
jgi:hypothetical protein